MQKITPYLWFDNQAEEAMQFYTTCFKNSRIVSIQRYPEGGTEAPLQGMDGKVLMGIFELAGYQFMTLDGGPLFKFTPAISFFVNCETEAELDALWEKLIEGGMAMMPLQAYPFSPKFGWLADKYGVSWQLNLSATPQSITPFFMFVGNQYGKAEEAMRFYTSLFEHAGIQMMLPYGTDEGETAGAIKQALFQLHQQNFMAIDSGLAHDFTFNEAVSLYVDCDSQAEIDHFWNNLSAHPDAEQCGWLKDKFGVSWQIVPNVLGDLMNDADPEKSKRVMSALLQMKKLEIAGLQQAYQG